MARQLRVPWTMGNLPSPNHWGLPRHVDWMEARDRVRSCMFEMETGRLTTITSFSHRNGGVYEEVYILVEAPGNRWFQLSVPLYAINMLEVVPPH